MARTRQLGKTPRWIIPSSLLLGMLHYRCMRPMRLDTAQHEAAHVVVARALGVRVSYVTAQESEDAWGYTSHTDVRKRRPLVEALIAAAGLVYEARAPGPRNPGWAASDYMAAKRACRRAGVSMRVVTRLASALLHERAAVHDRVARALCERDLSAKDLQALERCACACERECECECVGEDDT